MSKDVPIIKQISQKNSDILKRLALPLLQPNTDSLLSNARTVTAGVIQKDSVNFHQRVRSLNESSMVKTAEPKQKKAESIRDYLEEEFRNRSSNLFAADFL